MRIRIWWQRVTEHLLPPRRVVTLEADGLPNRLPRRNLLLLRDAGEDWSVGMQCPCGCGQRIELPLLAEVKPRWNIRVDQLNRPTLSPSVWLRDGCRSHFFVKNGRIVWV